MKILTRKPIGTLKSRFLESAMNFRGESFPSYLSDESKLKGSAELVVFPESESEVALILNEAAKMGKKVTISAGRTGVVGGAVPLGGWALSVERLNQVHGFTFDDKTREYRIKVGPGITLEKLQKAVRSAFFPFACALDADTIRLLDDFKRESTKWIFPPDPTETTAQLGGMAASNASGARTFFFGPMRNHVRGLTIVLAGGEVIDISRDQHRLIRGKSFEITTTCDKLLSVPVPNYIIPKIKHACGYYSADELDLIDLFIGSEGTLGVITQIEIALRKIEGGEAEILAFFPDIYRACDLVQALRKSATNAFFVVEALEFMCSSSFELLDATIKEEFSNQIPNGAVGVFIGIRVLRDFYEAFSRLAKIIAEYGGMTKDSLAAYGPVDISRLKHIRHALPETINAIVAKIKENHPQLTKLGTDMSIPDHHLKPMAEIYMRRLSESGLRFFIFGHIGNNHFHINIIPRNPAEFEQGKDLYRNFAQEAVKMGGSVSAEHGIGKIKKYLLETQFDVGALDEMRQIKSALDPANILGIGNLFTK